MISFLLVALAETDAGAGEFSLPLILLLVFLFCFSALSFFLTAFSFCLLTGAGGDSLSSGSTGSEISFLGSSEIGSDVRGVDGGSSWLALAKRAFF